MVTTTKSTDTTSKKLSKYQTASIVKYAFLEVPALLSFLAAVQNGNALYLSIGIGLGLILALERPTKHKLVQYLPLTLSEKQHLNLSL